MDDMFKAMIDLMEEQMISLTAPNGTVRGLKTDGAFVSSDPENDKHYLVLGNSSMGLNAILEMNNKELEKLISSLMANLPKH